MGPKLRPTSFAFASLLIAMPALAQAPSLGGDQQAPVVHFSLSPYIGMVFPTSNLLSVAQGAGTGATTQDLKLSAAITGGARINIQFNSRIGIAADVGYSPGSLELAHSGSQSSVTANTDVTVLSGAGKLVVFLIPSTSFAWINVSGGAGMVRHSFKSTSTTYAGIKDATNVGAVIGASAGLRVWKLVSLTASVEDYLYNASFENGTTKTAERKQHDVRVTGGIGFPFLGM